MIMGETFDYLRKKTFFQEKIILWENFIFLSEILKK